MAKYEYKTIPFQLKYVMVQACGAPARRRSHSATLIPNPSLHLAIVLPNYAMWIAGIPKRLWAITCFGVIEMIQINFHNLNWRYRIRDICDCILSNSSVGFHVLSRFIKDVSICCHCGAFRSCRHICFLYDNREIRKRFDWKCVMLC